MSNLQRLYNNLANMAFWNAAAKAAAAPVPIDWGGPLHTVTLSLNLTNAVVKYNGVAVSNGDTLMVEEFKTLELTVEAASNYALSSVTSQVGTVSPDMTTVTLVMGQADVPLDITASASPAYSITYELTHLNAVVGPSGVIQGGGTTIVLAPHENHALPLVVQVTGATLSSYNNATGEIVITNSTGNVTIHADAICEDFRLLIPGVTVTNNQHTIYNYTPDNLSRGTIVVPRSGLVNANTWGTSSHNPMESNEVTARNTYSTIPIPAGATSMKIKFTNSAYYIAYKVVDSSAQDLLTSGWVVGKNEDFEMDFSQQPTATHAVINVKKADDGNLSNETLATFGFDLTFEL